MVFVVKQKYLKVGIIETCCVPQEWASNCSSQFKMKTRFSGYPRCRQKDSINRVSSVLFSAKLRDSKNRTILGVQAYANTESDSKINRLSPIGYIRLQGTLRFCIYNEFCTFSQIFLLSQI